MTPNLLPLRKLAESWPHELGYQESEHLAHCHRCQLEAARENAIAWLRRDQEVTVSGERPSMPIERVIEHILGEREG